MTESGHWECFSPVDVRYYEKELSPYLSEDGFTRYKLMVEIALVRVLARRSLNSAHTRPQRVARQGCPF